VLRLRFTALSLLLAAPATCLERFEAVEPAMGTLFRVVLYAESPTEARAGFEAAFARARELDARLSDYREDSELNRLCRQRRAQASEDLYAVLRIALEVARASGGAFDPTMGPFTRLWRESRRSGRLPGAAAIAEARTRTGWRKVHLHGSNRTVTLSASGMQLDLGGIAKGFAADQMLAVLRRLGLPRALVAASGDLAIGEAPPGRAGWTVEVVGQTHVLTNRGVSTSGPGEQFASIDGVRYAHIVNPRTGFGLINARTAGVLAPNSTLADALATAAIVLDVPSSVRLARRWKAVCLSKTKAEDD
jgi:FAD:protein FMN transferase